MDQEEKIENSSSSQRGIRSDAAYVEVLGQILFDLNTQANTLTCEVFAVINLQCETARQSYLSNAIEKAKQHPLPDSESKAIKLKQGKKVIQDQIKIHTEQALLNTARVCISYDEYKKNLQTEPKIQAYFFKSHFEKMARAIAVAQNNLAALESLKDLEPRLITHRAEIGGKSKPRPASKKDERQLLETMIKNIIYLDPALLSEAMKDSHSAKKSRDRISKRIDKINRETFILSYRNIDELKGQVSDILVTKIGLLNNKKPWSKVSNRKLMFLRNMLARPDKEITPMDEMVQADLAYRSGHRDGFKSFLFFLIEEKFGKPKDEESRAFGNLITPDELEQVYSQLNSANSWSEALEITSEPMKPPQ